MSPEKNSELIKNEARRIGFSACGISKAEFLEDEAPRLEKWLNENRHAQMSYMENHFDKRLDPTKLVHGAKSVISLTYNYFTSKKQTEAKAPKLSKYAYGNDYHFVVKKKLNELFSYIESEIGEVSGRVFVDSAPILEKSWAVKSGLGWIGKNTNLITKKQGSFFFIAEIISDLDLKVDAPVTDHCGTCTACIDACPTDAIIQPHMLDGSKCISYFTIELKNEIPKEVQGKFENWMFGCDICQDVCPWNRFSVEHREKEFDPKEELLTMTGDQWREITKETFDKIFSKSPVKRTKYKGLKRNIHFLNEH